MGLTRYHAHIIAPGQLFVDAEVVLASDAAQALAEKDATIERLNRDCTMLATTVEAAERKCARLQEIIDCANTPLMADVLRERDELRRRIAEQAETWKPEPGRSLYVALEDAHATLIALLSSRAEKAKEKP